MSKEYVLSEKKVTALARSKRRREGGVGGGAGHRSSGGVVSEDEAGWADRAGYAERAGEAVVAGHAERADEAIEAGHAESADEALEAVHAETADEAIEAGHAERADVSGRLSGDTVRMAWGQAFWEGGQPKDVSGSLTGVVDVTMTGDLSVGGDADIQGDAWIGGTVTVGGSGVASSDFRTGVSGFKLKRGSGGSELEIDRLYVRMKAYFDTLEIRRYIHSGGNRVASAAGCKLSRVISSSNGNLYRCYFKASDGYNKITNDWVAGDLAYCHTTNLANNSNLNQKYYWRLVVHTGGVNAARQVVVMDGTEYQREDMVITEHFIDLSNKSTETLTIDDEPLLVDGYDSGSDIPAAEDDVVQLGNVNDDTRRGAIVESVSGILSAPTYRLYQDIGSDIGDLYSLPDAKVDMGYNLSTKRAYLNVYGDFVFGSRSSGGSRISYNSSTGVLEIKAVIAASSPLSGDGIGPNVTLASYVADAVNNSEQDISAAYGYLAANLARKSVTSITGGLILSSLIGLRNTGGVVTAGINGQNEASGIALWLGGPMADIQNRRTGESVFAKTLLRFDGSGYLAGGNISWKEDGDTEVKGTIRAKNLFHNVCVFSDGGTYFGQDGDAWWYDPTDGTYENNPEVTDGKFQCTYDADVIILLPRGAQSWSDITPVLLPDPKDFAGKSVDVICMASSVGANGNVLVGSVGAGVAWYDGVLVGSAYKMGTLLYTNTEGDRYSVQLYNSQQHCYVSSPMQKSTFVSIRNGNNWYWCLVDSKYVGSGGGQQYVTRQDLDNAVDGFVRQGNSLSHYGILDAKIENGVITLGGNTITPLTQHQSLSGYATQSWCYNNMQPKMYAYNTVNGSPIGWFADIVAAGATVGGGKLVLNFLPLSGGALTGDLAIADAELKVSNGNGGWVHQEVDGSTYKFYVSQNAQNSTAVTKYQFDRDVEADRFNVGIDLHLEDVDDGTDGRIWHERGHLWFQHGTDTPVQIV